MSEKLFLNYDTDFNKFTEPENMLDYEIGVLEGLKQALRLTNYYKPNILVHKIKRDILGQKELLLEWLEDWEGLDE